MSDITKIEDKIKLKKRKQKYINEKEKIELKILMLEREFAVIEQQLKECGSSDWHDKQPMKSEDLEALKKDYMENKYFKDKEDE